MSSFNTDTFRGQLYFYTLHPERYDNIYPIRNKWSAKDYEDFMDFLDYDYLVKSEDYGYVWNEDLDIIDEIKEEIIEEYKSL